MWPFRKTRRIEKPTSMGMRIPFNDQETEVIPLEVDDQNLEDWKAGKYASPGKPFNVPWPDGEHPKLKRLPSDDPMLSTDHLPEAFWAISREEDHRVYPTPRGIKSALTQLNWHADGEVWKGVVYWHPVTEDYVDRPA